MPVSPKRMPFMGHMAELRRRLFIVVLVLGALAVGLYFVSDEIYNLLVAPAQNAIGTQGSFTFDVLEGMTNRFRLAVWAALVVGSPVIIYHALSFFVPALKPKERRWFLWTFFAAVVLFAAGVAFCYLLILEPSAQWLVEQNGETFELMLRASSMMQFAMWFMVGFGVAFEVPIVVFYLVYFEVVPYKTLRQNWRTVWVVIIIISAMITPDWSPVSMGALAGAMIGLFEGSMALVRVLLRKKIRAQKLELGED
ncbi:MAG: twin-arginine translocase subunit TatC [Coriobacteriia bacterium]|nr:twin-arginine translocase subunit TatC [Coriobacteriia bacterium]